MQPRTTRLLVTAIIAALVAALSGGFLLVRNASARDNVGAPVHASAAAHTINVSGNGVVSVAPDQTTITLGVQTKGDDAASALAANATRMTSVIAAVEAQGVAKKNIQTSDLSLYYDSDHQSYIVNHQITVVIDGTATAGAVLDAAIQAGANNSWGVSFGLKDASAARAQALQAAVVDARKHADSIAGALGVTISGVSSASEASYNSPPIQFGAVNAGVAAAPSTPIQAGQLTVTANVSVTYSFG